MIERPVETITLVSAVRAGLRARRRQYAARGLLAELREADRRKSEFLAVLSHELRNPLAPIRNAVQLIQRLPHDHPAHTKMVQTIDRQSAHMARILDDMLDIARVTRGHVLMLEPFRDANLKGVRRLYALSRNYFRGSIHGLERFGLEPVWATDDFPQEAFLGSPLVLAQKVKA